MRALEFDATNPRTRITKGPGARTKAGQAKFKFASNEPQSTFRCKIDSRQYKICFGTKQYKNLAPGRHIFRVYADDTYRNRDHSEATKRFRVPAQIGGAPQHPPSVRKSLPRQLLADARRRTGEG